jgi:ferredoxin
VRAWSVIGCDAVARKIGVSVRPEKKLEEESGSTRFATGPENVGMPRVRVEPLEIEFEAVANETVMDAANAAGYWWPVGCNRNGECTNCAMQVVSGVGRLSRMGRFERANLVRQRGQTSIQDPRLRLACQARVEGDVVLYKLGVRRDTL